MTQSLRTFGYGVMLTAILTLVLSSGGAVHAQQIPDPAQLLSPDQLDDMVAPIALYPDPLISQILVAATYPLEIVEASQWLQRNPNVQGASLSQAALDQDWDPSIQALVVFPDVMKFLMEDIAWTTNVGNAFLAQEGDVMDAIQRMRDRAARLGKLQTTPEQQVIRYVDAGQPIYEIVPVNPTVIYVPVYDPYYIWGAAAYYPYPRWYYPPRANHIYFNSGIYIDAYYGSGWYGSAWIGPSYTVWNNWGWRPAWNTRTVVVNNVFIDNHHFNSGRPRDVGATATASWSHDATHRRGVVYPASASYDRYRGDNRNAPRPQQAQNSGRNVPAQVSASNNGTSASRSGGTSADRSNIRDARPDTRPAVQQQAAQDTRVAGRGSTPNSQNRDNRGTSDLRNDRGASNSGSNRGASSSTPKVQAAAAAPASMTSSSPSPELSWSRNTPSQVRTVTNAQAPATPRQSAPQASIPNPVPSSTTRQAGPAQDQNRTRSAAAQPQTSIPNPVPSNTTRQAGPAQDQNRTRTFSTQVQTAAPNPTPVNVSRQAGPVQDQNRSYRTFQDDPTYIRQTQLSQNPASSITRTPTPNTVRESPNTSRAGERDTRYASPQQTSTAASSQASQSAPRQSPPQRSAAAESRQAPPQSAGPASNDSGRSSGGSSNTSNGSNGGSSQGGNSRGRR